MNNKRGQVAIPILVMMALVLMLAGLAMFYSNSGKVKTGIADTAFSDKIYSEAESLEYSISNDIRNKVVEFYSETDLDRDDSAVLEKRLQDKIDGEKINFKGEEKNVNVLLSGEKISFESESLLISGRVTLSEKKRIWVWGVIPSYSYEQLNAFIAGLYRTNLSGEVDLEREGLHSFGKIERVIGACKDNDINVMKNCIDKELFNFNSIVNKNGESSVVSLESKKKFLIEGKMSNIHLSLKLA